ncbi:MAG: hypothetical protein V4525_01455 [Pseudomonadota bacterium]
MSEDICNVINDVVILPEIEQTWELICEHMTENQQPTVHKLFEEGYIPPKQANVLPDGGLQIYALGKGGKIILNVPSEAWTYRVVH